MRVVGNPAPPTGFARLLFRLPIHLYRLRLGWLFGHRLMLLTHTGRVSGNPRHAVLEVVDRPQAGCYVACSGFGPQASWYRNVLATPTVTLQVGNRRSPALAQPLSESEGGEAMMRYAQNHPRAARLLCRFMGFAVDGGEADYREVGRHQPFVHFALRR